MIRSLATSLSFRAVKQATATAPGFRSFVTNPHPLFFRMSPCLSGEPLRKKKREDPAIARAREERRKKKIEKQIRRLEKNARQLKPIDENEIPEVIYKDVKGERTRRGDRTEEEAKEQRAVLRQWSAYRTRQHLVDAQMIDRILLSQQWALDNLQQESEFLYKAAIQVDETLMPFEAQGPYETPPIENYDTPDGEYVDISKNWDEMS